MTAQHPRLERLRAENFQSLAKADIELGAFSVIVGPSNSGKSALLRALRAITRNVNSPSAVRAGKTTFNAAVEFDGTVVSIERGKSQSTYRVALPDGREEVYTKAGRTVPEDVQSILAMPLPAGPDLVFSSQIDPPFLLSETGSVAAKILGDLTNVSKLHAAARESNRRRLEASKLQSLREEDAQAAAARMREQFSDLGEHAKVIRHARESLTSVREKAVLRDRLDSLLADLDVAEAAEEDLNVRLKELPRPADIENLAEKAGELLGRRLALIDILDGMAKATQAAQQLEAVLKDSLEEQQQAEKDYHDALVQAGTCPTCDQPVEAK